MEFNQRVCDVFKLTVDADAPLGSAAFMFGGSVSGCEEAALPACAISPLSSPQTLIRVWRWIILTEIKNSRVFVSFNHHVVSSLTLLHAAPRRRRPTFTPAIQTLMTKSPRSSTFRSDRWPAATAAAPLPQRRSSKLPWGRLRCHPTEGRSSRLALISFKWGYIWDVHVNPPQNSLKTYS